MPTLRFVTADVFTSAPFTGNPLAVVFGADDLPTATLHAIAREFNYSETVFVFPPDDPAHSRRVRIFTPEEELPEGVDAEFLYPAVVEGTDTSLGDWPAPDFIDSLFPSQSYAVSRRDYILRQLNGPADTLTLTGPLQCGTAIQLLLEYSYNSKTYKAMSIEWDFVGNRTTIVLHRKGGE